MARLLLHVGQEKRQMREGCNTNEKTMMFVILMLGWVVTAQAQEGKVKGLMFGDYYYVFAADETDTKHSPSAMLFSSAVCTSRTRAISPLTLRFAFALRLGDAGFAQGAKMEPFVKHGYLQWKKGLGDADIYLGLSGTPTWAVAEKVWGYRSIAKTALDGIKSALRPTWARPSRAQRAG